MKANEVGVADEEDVEVEVKERLELDLVEIDKGEVDTGSRYKTMRAMVRRMTMMRQQ